MCLVAIAIGRSARFPLVIAANRDEYYDRPAVPLAWWSPDDGGPQILGGRDLQGGGTWLGLTQAGRLALLTNVRNPGRNDPRAPSRGAIVQAWLRGDVAADVFFARIALGGYNGYNIIAADFARGECSWASNTGEAPRRMERGLWGLSNAGLDTPWPKVVALKQRLHDAIERHSEVDELAGALFRFLGDRQQPGDGELPSTGVPLDWERALSSAFIELPERNYGTRCSTVVATERRPDGLATHVFERSFSTGSPIAVQRRALVHGWPPVEADARHRDVPKAQRDEVSESRIVLAPWEAIRA